MLDVSRDACPSPHSTKNKLGRVAWGICWWLLFRPSPRVLFKWRVLVLRLFGTQASWSCRVDPTVRIWAPWNLTIGRDASMGHHVDCYNVARITLGDQATVSQEVFLCTASHSISDPNMGLISAPIQVQSHAWLCARCYVAPGVTIAEGAVAGACAVVTKNVEPWHVVVGNPASILRTRELDHQSSSQEN